MGMNHMNLSWVSELVHIYFQSKETSQWFFCLNLDNIFKFNEYKHVIYEWKYQQFSVTVVLNWQNFIMAWVDKLPIATESRAWRYQWKSHINITGFLVKFQVAQECVTASSVARQT